MTDEKSNKKVKKDKSKPKETPKKSIPKKTKPIQPHLYSLEELSDFFGLSVYKMSSLYRIRGIDKNVKMGLEEAREKFKNIRI